MADQRELARMFLEALFTIGDKQEDSKKVVKSLGTVKTVVEQNLPLTESIATKLLQGLTINFRFYSRKPVNQLKLVSENSGEVVEEYLLVLFSQVINAVVGRHTKLLKEPECIVVLLDTSLQMIRTKQKQLLLEVLNLVATFVKFLVEERPESVHKVLPSTVSTLFNLVLNQQTEIRSVKSKQIALKVITELLCHHFKKKPQSAKHFANPLSKSTLDPTVQHIKRYVETLTRNLETLGLQEKYQQVQQLVNRVLPCPGVRTPELLPDLYKLAYTVGSTPNLSLESEYNQSVVSEALREEMGCQLALLANASKNLINSEEQLKRLRFIGRVLAIPKLEIPYEESNKLVGQLLCALRTDINPKVRLTLNSTVVPLEKLNGSMKLQSAQDEALLHSYNSVKDTQLLNTFKLFQSEIPLLKAFESLVEGVSEQLARHWLEQLSERLEVCSYDVQMNLRQLSEYLALVYMLSLVTKHSLHQPTHLNGIYNRIRKSQPLTQLKVSYEEEELLVILSLQTVSNCSSKLMQSSKNKLDVLNSKLALSEIILGLSDEEVYSVTLLSNRLLLRLSEGQTVAEFLLPLVPTLFYRNQRHIKLLTALVRLTAVSLPEVFAEKVASDYYLLKDTQQMIMLLIPKLPTNLARRCLLAMSEQSRWVEALMSCAQHLSQQPMKNELNESMSNQPFYANDRQNSTVNDCLGVVLLEIGTNYWQMQLEGKRCGRILDLLLKLFSINPHMIFFRNLYELFPSFQRQLDRLKENTQSYGLGLCVQKILRLLQQYYTDEQLKRMKIKGAALADLSASLELLTRKIKIELYTAQNQQQRTDMLRQIRDLGDQVIDIICRSCEEASKESADCPDH